MLVKKIITVLLMGISIFFIVYFAEKILSFTNEKKSNYSELHEGCSRRYILLREHEPLKNVIVEPNDSYMKISDSLVQKKYRLRVDENGFIMPSKIYDQPDMSIVFLGGSTTECLYMDEENRFPYLTGRILEKETGKKVNSYNSGISGNNSLHSLDILLNKIIPMKPNVVIMQHNINDLVILMLRNTYWNFHPDEGPIVYPNTVIWNNPLKQALKRFVPNLYYRLRAIKDKALRRFEDDEFKDVRGTLVYIDKRRIQNEFRMNLQTFINICTVRKIAPVLMTQQNRFKEHLDEVIYNSVRILKSDYGIEYKDYKEAYDLLNETIRKVGKDNNILVIDLANEIPQEKEYIYDPVHLNDTGSKLTAQVINRELKKIINNVK